MSWEFRKQKTVALSMAEAEYMCLTESAKEAIHLHQLSSDMAISSEKITIFNDNQASHELALNPSYEKVDVVYCPRGDIDADSLTKTLSGLRFGRFCNKIGLTLSSS
ncbi:hypothetical protein JTB14_015969 [Gonioctena quinquepunctata]|nr:hypothetical protein JTB14_015969 [Gonioctena quinquepunctata]